jgi:membrane protease subunit (stomatin/prohibitin family)
MGLRVSDSRKLLLKLVGTEDVLQQAMLVNYFRAFLMTRVKTYIAQTMKSSTVNVFEIDERLMEFSDELQGRLTPDFADYGLSLERFFVTTIVKPDGEAQYEKFKDLYFRQYADIAEAQLRQKVGVIDQQTEAQKLVIEAQGLAQKRSAEGYTYQQERGFNVAEKAAQNEGAGGFSSMGIGLGMMAGVGSSVGSAVGGAVGSAMNPVSQLINGKGTEAQPDAQNSHDFCENCGKPLQPDADFCEECGAGKPAALKCPSCGYRFERQGKYCPKCGAKREAN